MKAMGIMVTTMDGAGVWVVVAGAGVVAGVDVVIGPWLRLVQLLLLPW
jgi:hypothetical protein